MTDALPTGRESARTHSRAPPREAGQRGRGPGVPAAAWVHRAAPGTGRSPRRPPGASVQGQGGWAGNADVACVAGVRCGACSSGRPGRGARRGQGRGAVAPVGSGRHPGACQCRFRSESPPPPCRTVVVGHAQGDEPRSHVGGTTRPLAAARGGEGGLAGRVASTRLRPALVSRGVPKIGRRSGQPARRVSATGPESSVAIEGTRGTAAGSVEGWLASSLARAGGVPLARKSGAQKHAYAMRQLSCTRARYPLQTSRRSPQNAKIRPGRCWTVMRLLSQ